MTRYIVDAENDGDPDLYLGFIYGMDKTWLLLNDGEGRFSDAGEGAIPRRAYDNQAQAQGGFVEDVNHDGLDDLLLLDTAPGVANQCPDGLEPSLISLLISNGDGTFRDETFLRTPQTTADCGDFGFLDDFDIGDINGDGATDIFIQAAPNEYWLNDGHGYFTELPDGFDYPGDNFFWVPYGPSG